MLRGGRSSSAVSLRGESTLASMLATEMALTDVMELVLDVGWTRSEVKPGRRKGIEGWSSTRMGSAEY